MCAIVGGAANGGRVFSIIYRSRRVYYAQRDVPQYIKVGLLYVIHRDGVGAVYIAIALLLSVAAGLPLLLSPTNRSSAHCSIFTYGANTASTE